MLNEKEREKFILRKREEICRMLRERNFAAQCEKERELESAPWIRTGNSFSARERR